MPKGALAEPRRRRLSGDSVPRGAVFVGLTSIHWREAWKYGERAYRYCQHDVGHAIAAASYAAATLGWRARLVTALADDDLGLLLRANEQEGIEAEHPDALVALSPRSSAASEPRGASGKAAPEAGAGSSAGAARAAGRAPASRSRSAAHPTALPGAGPSASAGPGRRR